MQRVKNVSINDKENDRNKMITRKVLYIVLKSALEYCIGVLYCLWYSGIKVEPEIPMYLPSLQQCLCLFISV